MGSVRRVEAGSVIAMPDTTPPEIAVDLLMRRVREDAIRERQGLPLSINDPTSIKSRAAFSTFNLPRLPETADALPRQSHYTLDDFLNLHDEDFLRAAYQALLDRPPDASGRETYLGGLRAGRLSKIDILGRLRFSREGRNRGVSVRGLLLPWLAHTAYRIPVLGYLLAWLSALARLPRWVGHWSRFEAFTMFQRREQTAQINAVLAQLETELRHTRQRLATCEARLQCQERSCLASPGTQVPHLNSSAPEQGKSCGIGGEG